MIATKLPKIFFENPTVEVAQSLIGQGFHFHGINGVITETEAYVGQDDPACHAAKGKTPRNAVMFDAAGKLYVYMIYVIHHCMNVVTESEGFPAAVLIRGLYLPEQKLHLDGPGKLCKFLKMDRSHNAIDVIESDACYFFKTKYKLNFTATSRIGIKKGIEKPWRFVSEYLPN